MGMDNRVEFRRMQVYDLAHIDQTFDLVLFMGVFYHLRYPMLGLDIVAQKVRRLLLFQTLTMPGEEVFEKTWEDPAAGDPQLGMNSREVLHERGWPKMAFIEHRFSGDPTNWWLVSHAGAEAMLRSSGMKIIGHPGHEMYLCEPDPQHPSCVSTWNAAEILSATGRPWQEEPEAENPGP
jgi:tRNA (mo5U34)-methyltransferase